MADAGAFDLAALVMYSIGYVKVWSLNNLGIYAVASGDRYCVACLERPQIVVFLWPRAAIASVAQACSAGYYASSRPALNAHCQPKKKKRNVGRPCPPLKTAGLQCSIRNNPKKIPQMVKNIDV